MDGDSGRSEMVEEVPEVTPLDLYDTQRSKFQASVQWVLSKAYNDKIPKNLKDQGNEGDVVSVQVIRLLASGELYCLTCRNMFKDTSTQWQGHWTVIQALSRRGIYVVEDNDVAVTENSLSKISPLQTGAHLAMIDALMTAYTKEVITIERVVHAVRRFATFNASSELPYDIEDAVLFWINKVCTATRHKLDKDQKIKQQQLLQQGSQMIRLNKKQLQPKSLPEIPVMDDLLKDITDGACIATLVSFYCPDYLRLEDICLKSVIGIADSIHNHRLVERFCHQCLPTRCFHFCYEDLLYSHSYFKVNILAFLAELFYHFEVQKAGCVRNITAEKENINQDEGVGQSKSTKLGLGHSVPISNATKKSFQGNRDLSDSNPDIAASTASLPPRQPLLHKRVQQNKESSSGDNTGDEMAHQSVLAWQEKNQSGRLLANVSIDSEISGSLDLSQSLDLGDLDNAPPEIGSDRPSSARRVPAEHDHEHVVERDLEVQSMSSRATSAARSQEPLMSARLKPLKERNLGQSKEVESGEILDRGMRQKVPVELDQDMSDTESSDEEYATPNHSDTEREEELSDRRKSALASYFDDLNEDSVLCSVTPRQSAGGTASSHGTVGESFTVQDQFDTPEAARAAGIPVVDSTDYSSEDHMNQSTDRISTSSSDQESTKIHADKKHREIKSGLSNSFYMTRSDDEPQLSTRPDSLFVMKPLTLSTAGETLSQKKTQESPTTSFAEIKKLRANLGLDQSGAVYMQNGQDRNQDETNRKISLKDEFQKSKGKKTTSFAALPNQTTWQQAAQQRQQRNAATNGNSNSSLASDLHDVRLQLQQKRNFMENEKKRQETERHKERQRIGKAAFLQVVTKGKSDEDSSGGENSKRPVNETIKSLRSEPSVNRVGTSATDSSKPSDLASRRRLSDDDSAKPTRAFSREEIQHTIDGVKQRWFKPDGTPNTSTPNKAVQSQRSSESQRSHEGSPRLRSGSGSSHDSDHSSPRQGSTEPKDADRYNNSLTKLNRSLNDLQGEIMRLSLQQERMKNMTLDTQGSPQISPRETTAIGNEDKTTPRRQWNVGASPGDLTAQKSHAQSTYFLNDKAEVPLAVASKAFQSTPSLAQPDMMAQFPQQGGVQIHDPHLYADVYQNPAMRPAFVPPAQQGPVPQAQQNYIMHPGASYNNQFQPVSSSQGQQHAGMMPGQHIQQTPAYGQSPQQGYMTGSQYGSQFIPTSPQVAQTYPQQPQIINQPTDPYQQGFMTSPGHIISPQHMAPHVVTSPGMAFHPQPHMATTYTVSSNQTYNHPQTPTMQAQTPTLQAQTPVLQAQTPINTQNMVGPNTTETPVYQANMDETYASQEPAQEIQQTDKEQTFMVETNVVEYGGNDGDQQGSEGFFVAFDVNSQPKKSKPKLSSRTNHKKETSGPTYVPEPVMSAPPIAATSSLLSNLGPGTGFEIPVNSAVGLDHSFEEKKKEKFMMMQLKRQEEQEKKRQKLEAESARKREEQRIKQIETEKKKADEKARRELIYEQYKQKKHEKEEVKVPVKKRTGKSSRGRDENNPKPQRPASTALSGIGSMLNPHFDEADNTSFKVNLSSLTHRRSASPPGSLTTRKGPAPRSALSEPDNGSNHEYTGPKLFVKPSAKSNRNIISNAIQHCCLAGVPNQELKNKAMEELNMCDAKHFLILFRDANLVYKALYSYYPEKELVLKIHGVGPKQITNEMCDKYYKYNSGAKEFHNIASMKHLSVSVDACTIHNSLWLGKKAAAPKKSGLY